MSKWRLLGIACLVVMLLLIGSVLDQDVEILGADVPAWVAVFAAYLLGAFALHAQYRGDGRLGSRGSRTGD